MSLTGGLLFSTLSRTQEHFHLGTQRSAPASANALRDLDERMKKESTSTAVGAFTAFIEVTRAAGSLSDRRSIKTSPKRGRAREFLSHFPFWAVWISWPPSFRACDASYQRQPEYRAPRRIVSVSSCRVRVCVLSLYFFFSSVSSRGHGNGLAYWINIVAPSREPRSLDRARVCVPRDASAEYVALVGLLFLGTAFVNVLRSWLPVAAFNGGAAWFRLF